MGIYTMRKLSGRNYGIAKQPIPQDEKAKQAQKEQYQKILSEYYIEAHKTILRLGNIKDGQMREFLTSHLDNRLSSKNRMHINAQVLKHLYITERTNVVTTCFKVEFEETSSIYAYIHGEWLRNDIIFQFMCLGPTFRSQDGEYRGRVIYSLQYKQIFDTLGELLEPIERAILTKIVAGELKFHHETFYATKCKYSHKEYENKIQSYRFAVKLYMLCWIYDFYHIHNKTMENHINPAYQYIMYRPEYIPIFDALYEKLGPNKYKELVVNTTRCRLNITRPEGIRLDLQCGQKLFPMTVLETSYPSDVRYEVWREMEMSLLASNIVLNFISPSFPLFGNWFYIQNTNEDIFDNFAMHEKYTHAEIAAEITRQLKEADKYAFLERDPTQGYISNKFFKLSRNMRKAAIYAETDIKLTDVTLCAFSEYVGRTLRDIPAFIAAKDYTYGTDKILTNADVFAKHMFEFIYAMYCMNTKIGIFHGDLHMNNATIFRMYDFSTLPLKNTNVAYIIGESVYLFPHYGLYSAIIDFSRSIMGDFKKMAKERTELFAEVYFSDQNVRVLSIMGKYLPELVEKYHEEIRGLLLNKFPLMFKILTAVDAFALSSGVKIMLTVEKVFTTGDAAPDQVKIPPDNITLSDEISAYAEKLLNDYIMGAINGRLNVPGDIEWPNLSILRHIFAKYLVTAQTITEANKIPLDLTPVLKTPQGVRSNPALVLTDIFNYNNVIEYDISDPDKWGPLISSDFDVELSKKYNQPEHTGIGRWLEIKQHDDTNEIEELVAPYRADVFDPIEDAWMLM